MMNIRNFIKYAGCNSFDIYSIDSSTSFYYNRILGRPLSGGQCMSNFLNMYGTLGGLFVDDTDGSIVGLTCRHVCDIMKYIGIRSYGKEINSPVTPPRLYPLNYDYLRTRFTSLSDRLCQDFRINSDTVVYKDQYPNNYNREYADIKYVKTYKDINYELVTSNRTEKSRDLTYTSGPEDEITIPVQQPGYPLTNKTTYADFMSGFSVPTASQNNLLKRTYPYTIGHIKRVASLITDERFFNEIDTAVIAIEKSPYGDTVLDENSFKYIGFNYNGPVLFATTDEINSLTFETPLFMTGAGTGPVGSYGTIQPSCLDISFVDYYSFIAAEGVNYSNGIIFSVYDKETGRSGVVSLSSLEGNSGSMLWALFNSNNPTTSAWKIIGQVFAFSNETSPLYGYACRMDNIQKILKISPWNGENIKYNPRAPKLFTSFSIDEAVTKLNRICFRVSNTLGASASYNISTDQTVQLSGGYRNTVIPGFATYTLAFYLDNNSETIEYTGQPITYGYKY